MPRFLLIVDKISLVLAILAGAALLILITDMMYEVISRRAFSAPTLWAYDIAYMANGMGFLFAAGYTLRKNGHIRIDFLSTRLSLRCQDWINVAAYIFLILPAFSFFIIGAYNECFDAFVTDKLDPASPWKPLLWPLYAGLLIGFIGLLLQSIAECLRHLRGALGFACSPLAPAEELSEGTDHA